MATLMEITEKNFDKDVIKSKIPVLVDFWAVWCGPCKLVAPIVEELATEYAGKLKVGKCDVDSNQSIAVQFGIRSIPTLLVFKDGKVVQQVIGATSKQAIKSKIEEVF